MKGLASIVVGLDFTECSRVALGHALRLASWSNAAVHAVHVIDAGHDEMGGEAPLTELQREFRGDLIDKARTQWEAFAEGIPGARELHLDVCVAHRLAGIRRQLDRYDADLLVLGAFGEEKPHVGIGTLVSACVRSVPTDVLIVRDAYRDAFRTVVVGIDFSTTCQHALEAAALVAHGETAKLYAVHVVPSRVETYARLRSELGPDLESFVKATTNQYPELEVLPKV